MYLVGQNKISKIPTIGCSSNSVIKIYKELEAKELGIQNESLNSSSILNALKRPLDIIALLSSTNADFIQKLTQLQLKSLEIIKVIQ